MFEKSYLSETINKNLLRKANSDEEDKKQQINAIIAHWNKQLTLFPADSISFEQEEKARKFWNSFTGIEVTDWIKYYSCRNGTFDTRYIPDSIFYSIIDPYYNDNYFADVFDNKAYYPLLFADVLQPDILATRINGVWLDKNYNPITLHDVVRECVKENQSVIKPARCSCGGLGISFLDITQNEERLIELLNKSNTDLVIQKIIQQHKILNCIHPSSVNTLRFLTLLRNKGAIVLSSVLRMGINGSKVDNASVGGITCGVLDGGRLKRLAFNKGGQKFYSHPQGVEFEDIVVPGFEKAKELIIKLQNRFPYCAMISWDISINEDAEPILVEANFSKGQLDFHQLNNGPVFGDFTNEILTEVFK